MRLVRLLWIPWWHAAREALEAMEIVTERSRLGPFLLLAAAIAGWVVYVPVHELLHAAGCLACGGRVDELQLRPMYGGTLLDGWIPFVRAGGDYAGRLTGFDTGDSDLVYLVTVAAPFTVSLLAFLLLRLAPRRGGPIWAGLGTVLLVGILSSIPGDYYELGSILVSDALDVSTNLPRDRLQDLRHDDILVLWREFPRRFPRFRWAWGAAVVASALVGVCLASGTVAAAWWLAGRPPGVMTPHPERAAPASESG
ncbi:MAG: hypothetical protein PVF68_04805 [Acidobacteriota bacterium]|jgi:hypothetical protein